MGRVASADVKEEAKNDEEMKDENIKSETDLAIKKEQETVQIQFSVTGAVKNKAYLLTKEEFETMRPNAPENSVFFCQQKYLDTKSRGQMYGGSKVPILFKTINPKYQKETLKPTRKLV